MASDVAERIMPWTPDQGGGGGGGDLRFPNRIATVRVLSLWITHGTMRGLPMRIRPWTIDKEGTGLKTLFDIVDDPLKKFWSLMSVLYDNVQMDQ